MPLIINPVLRHVIIKPRRPILTYRSNAASGTNASSYTFSAMAIGPEAADRLVIALIFGQDSAGTAGDACSSVTIGGITATLHVSGVGTSANECNVTVCSALGVGGTTADVVPTWAAGRTRAGAAVYSLTGYRSATPVETGGAEAEDSVVSLQFNVAGNQVGVIGSTVNSGSAQTAAWIHATSDTEFALESNDDAASATLNPGGFLTRTASWTATGSLALAGAVWG